jgi:LEA14-like dessication related protein
MNAKLLAALVIVILVIAAGFYINDMISSAKKISVKVDKMEIVSAGLEKATVRVTFCMENPSGYHYSAEDIRYNVYVEGTKVGNGTVEKVDILPKTTSCDSGLLDLYYSELGKAVVSFLLQGKVDVNVNGTMKVNVLFFPVEVKFSETRTIKP